MRYKQLLHITLFPVLFLGLIVSFLRTSAEELDGVAVLGPQATFTVNDTNDAEDANPGDGICETALGNDICTLRAAVMETNALTGRDTIMVPAGNYVLTITSTNTIILPDPLSAADVSANDRLPLAGGLSVVDSVDIIGAGAEETVINGGGIGRIFFISPPGDEEITISGLTLRNSSIGAVCNCTPDARVAIADVIITENNHYLDGGGISNSGQMTITNSSIVANVARGGAGIWNRAESPSDPARLLIINSTIANNTAGPTSQGGSGGGILNRGLLTILGSTISGNRVENWDKGTGIGGGIANNRKVTLINSTISNNWAFYGGGLFNDGAEATFQITNTTIFSNDAQFQGSAIGSWSSAGEIGLVNTIVAGDGTQCWQPGNNISSYGHNLESGDSCGFDALGDIINTDPLLGPLQDNGGTTWTHALLENSLAVDNGDNASCAHTDQRGVIRPSDGDGDGESICDIGAYEFLLPGLRVFKTGPESAAPHEFITYILTVENTLQVSVTNVILTDTIPENAGYIMGGTRVGDVISWTVPGLMAGEVFSRHFVVTATETITNSDYWVSADGGYQASGDTVVVTIINRYIYLPVILKP